VTWIKICGTTNLQDARESLEAGASALGFIFAPGPRRVDIFGASAILAELTQEDIETVAVFVNEHPRRIGEVVSQVACTGVQLHGDELPEDMKEYRETLGGRQIIKALHAKELLEEGGEEKLDRYLATDIDAILLDSGSAEEPGGTGKPFEWERAAPLAAKIRGVMPLIIAGGLTPENVAEAIDLFQPWGVDVVSGVEFEPGKKSSTKVRHFIAAVREKES
jgi:phosphoribosylanthranilate isomerase